MNPWKFYSFKGIWLNLENITPRKVDHAVRNSTMKAALVLLFAASVTGQGIICSKRLAILDAIFDTTFFSISATIGIKYLHLLPRREPGAERGPQGQGKLWRSKSP